MALAALDTDVLLKGASYGLLNSILESIPSTLAETHVLGAAKYIVQNRMSRLGDDLSISRLRSSFDDLIAGMRVVEPDDTEIGLAAELEFTAQRMGVSLDSGESLLCAIVVRRSLDFLVTGDKRAIRALAQILAERSMIDKLAGRVVCLEQLMIKVLASGVFSEVRNAICKNAKIDRALAICFSCSREDVTLDQVGDGLQSYVADLRRDASSIMCP